MKSHLSLPVYLYTLTVLAALCLTPVRSARADYQLIDLGTLGGSRSRGLGINSRLQIAGDSDLSNQTDTHAALFRFDGSNSIGTDLGTLGGNNSFAVGINSLGWVAGSADDANGASMAFLHADGQMRNLGTLEDDVASTAYSVNTQGQVVGVSFTPFNDQRAFLFDNNQMLDLGSLGGWSSGAFGINEDGVIVGYSFDAAGTRRAFIRNGATMTDLLAGTSEAGTGDSIAWAISGEQVAGQFTTKTGDIRGFVYNPVGGQFADLGTLGGTISVAYGVNASGAAVGNSTIATGQDEFRAFVWEEGELSDLNSVLQANPDKVTLTGARSINDAGHIAAVGTVDGVEHAYLLLRLRAATGNAKLQGLAAAAPARELTFEFRPTQGGASIIRTVSVDASGAFAFADIPSGEYTLAVKGTPYLRATTPVQISRGDVKSIEVTLLAGDINGDNRINLTDLIQLRAAYGTVPGNPQWNAKADLNGDGRVNLTDLILLRGNYGNVTSGSQKLEGLTVVKAE